MTTHRITYPGRPPMTSNDQRRATWPTIRKAKSDVALVIASLAKAIPPLGRISATFVWFAPDARRRDVDAIAPFVKAALDALVPRVIADDDARFVHSVTLGPVVVDRANPRIEITLTQEAPQ